MTPRLLRVSYRPSTLPSGLGASCPPSSRPRPLCFRLLAKIAPQVDPQPCPLGGHAPWVAGSMMHRRPQHCTRKTTTGSVQVLGAAQLQLARHSQSAWATPTQQAHMPCPSCSKGMTKAFHSSSPALHNTIWASAAPGWAYGSALHAQRSYSQQGFSQAPSFQPSDTQHATTDSHQQQLLASRHARRRSSSRAGSPPAPQVPQPHHQESTSQQPAEGVAGSQQDAFNSGLLHAPSAPYPPAVSGASLQAGHAQPVLQSAIDRLYQQLTEPKNALETIQELLAFKKVQHNTLVNQLIQLHETGRLSQQQLARLYGISMQTNSPTGLTWQDITTAFSELPSKLRGRQKRCEAVHQLLQTTHSMQIFAQERQHQGITELQIALVQRVLQANDPGHEQKRAAVAAGVGPEYAQALKLLPPATIKNVRLYLEGHSVDDISKPPLSGKRPIKVTTVRRRLVEAVKAGVALPQDRLVHDFKLTGEDGGVTYNSIKAMVQRLQQQQQYTPNWNWYNKVRSHLLMDEEPTKTMVEAQEASMGEGEGWSFTIDQIRLVTHLCRQEQQQHERQQPLELHGILLTQPADQQHEHIDEELIAAARQGFQSPEEPPRQGLPSQGEAHRPVQQPVRLGRRSRSHSRMVAPGMGNA